MFGGGPPIGGGNPIGGIGPPGPPGPMFGGGKGGIFGGIPGTAAWSSVVETFKCSEEVQLTSSSASLHERWWWHAWHAWHGHP
jgi:hypothetical protein